jgi:hypothetical protein
MISPEMNTVGEKNDRPGDPGSPQAGQHQNPLPEKKRPGLNRGRPGRPSAFFTLCKKKF